MTKRRRSQITSILWMLLAVPFLLVGLLVNNVCKALRCGWDLGDILREWMFGGDDNPFVPVDES